MTDTVTQGFGRAECAGLGGIFRPRSGRMCRHAAVVLGQQRSGCSDVRARGLRQHYVCIGLHREEAEARGDEKFADVARKCNVGGVARAPGSSSSPSVHFCLGMSGMYDACLGPDSWHGVCRYMSRRRASSDLSPSPTPRIEPSWG